MLACRHCLNTATSTGVLDGQLLQAWAVGEVRIVKDDDGTTWTCARKTCERIWDPVLVVESNCDLSSTSIPLADGSNGHGGGHRGARGSDWEHTGGDKDAIAGNSHHRSRVALAPGTLGFVAVRSPPVEVLHSDLQPALCPGAVGTAECPDGRGCRCAVSKDELLMWASVWEEVQSGHLQECAPDGWFCHLCQHVIPTSRSGSGLNTTALCFHATSTRHSQRLHDRKPMAVAAAAAAAASAPSVVLPAFPQPLHEPLAAAALDLGVSVCKVDRSPDVTTVGFKREDSPFAVSGTTHASDVHRFIRADNELTHAFFVRRLASVPSDPAAATMIVTVPQVSGLFAVVTRLVYTFHTADGVEYAKITHNVCAMDAANAGERQQLTTKLRIGRAAAGTNVRCQVMLGFRLPVATPTVQDVHFGFVGFAGVVKRVVHLHPTAPSGMGLKGDFVQAVHAVHSGDTLALAMLLGSDVDPTHDDPVGSTSLLHEACYIGDLDAIRLLVLAGADDEAQDASGRTPADVARACNHGAVTSFLTRLHEHRLSAPDRAVESFLHAEAEEHCALNPEGGGGLSLKALLEAPPTRGGESVSPSPDELGMLTIRRLERSKTPLTLSTLGHRIGNPGFRSPETHDSIIHYSVSRGHYDLALELIDVHGINVDSRAAMGETPLSLVVTRCLHRGWFAPADRLVIDGLLQRGADDEVTDVTGRICWATKVEGAQWPVWNVRQMSDDEIREANAAAFEARLDAA